jgi:periplasmic copper chaperone A
MSNRRLWAFASALVLAGIPPCAHAVLAINLPWVRVAGNAASAEVFMEIQSSEGATLVDARSDAATSVTIRRPGKGTGTIGKLPLPAGVPVMLAPDGYRLALTRLTHPIKLGDRVPLTLTLEAEDGTRQEISIDAEVRRRSALDDHLHPHTH